MRQSESYSCFHSKSTSARVKVNIRTPPILAALRACAVRWKTIFRHQIPHDDHQATANKRGTEGLSKMDKKIQKYSKDPLPRQKTQSIDRINISKTRPVSLPGFDPRPPVHKPVNNQRVHKSMNKLAGNIGTCNL